MKIQCVSYILAAMLAVACWGVIYVMWYQPKQIEQLEQQLQELQMKYEIIKNDPLSRDAMEKGVGQMKKNLNLPEGERPIEIVIGENIERYFLVSEYSSISAFANDLGCDSTRVKKVIEGKSVFSVQILQRAAMLLNIKTLDLFEDWSE